MATRTFADANVLILAFRGVGQAALDAQAIIDDPDRDFIASDILRLELLPKAAFHQQSSEEQFYVAFFQSAIEIVETDANLVRVAELEARSAGLSAADSLHVAAAKAGSADELVTAELPTKPLFRVQGLKIVSIRP